MHGPERPEMPEGPGPSSEASTFIRRSSGGGEPGGETTGEPAGVDAGVEAGGGEGGIDGGTQSSSTMTTSGEESSEDDEDDEDDSSSDDDDSHIWARNRRYDSASAFASAPALFKYFFN